MAIKVKHQGSVASTLVAAREGGAGARRQKDAIALAQQEAAQQQAAEDRASRERQALLSASRGGGGGGGGGGISAPSPGGGGSAPLLHANASVSMAHAAAPSRPEFEVTGDDPNKRPDRYSVWNDRTGQWERGRAAYGNWQGEQDMARRGELAAESDQRRLEGWKEQYSFGQRERISEINEAIDAVQNDDSLSEAQKQDALRQLKGKLYGIKPLETPPEEPPKIPEPVFHGENNELMWDHSKGMWIANPALVAKGGKGGADAGKPKYTAKDINDAAKELTITDPDTGETKGPDLSTPEGQQAVIQHIRQREAIMAQLNGEEVNLPGRTNAQGAEVPASVPIGAEIWATGVNNAQGAQGNASGAQGVPVFDGTKANIEMGKKEASQHDDFLLNQIPKGPEGKAFVENWIKNYEQAISQEKDPKNRGMWGHQLEVLKGKLGEFGEKSGESAPAANKAPKANPVVTESISDDDVFKGMPEEPKQRKKWLRKEIYEERKYLRTLSRGDANLRAVTEERIKRLENKLEEDGE